VVITIPLPHGLDVGEEMTNQRQDRKDDKSEHKHHQHKGDEGFDESVARARLAGKTGNHFLIPLVRRS
jgi:hypothetical protein